MSERAPTELSKDVVFDLLSSPRRRYVLYYLAEEEAPVELGELAEEVAAWENEVPVEELTRQQRKRVYVSLYQTHIPKLKEAGIITYDADAGVVSFGEHADQVGRHISHEAQESRWIWAYLALALGGTLFFLGVFFGVGPLAGMSETVAAVLVLAAVIGLALLHRLYHRPSERAVLDLVDRE